MLYIFDRKENLLEILTEEDYSDFKHITKVNSSDSLSFSTSKKKNIKKNNKVGFFKDEKFQLFLIYDFNDTISLDENKIDIECISDFNLLGNFIIEDKRIVNGTLREAAQKALEGMDYQVGITEDFELRNINFYFISRLKALNDILDTFKAEFDIRIEIDEATGRITNKYIDFKHRLGEDTGLRFTFDTNLKSIEKSPVGDHFNVLYGRGKSLETDNGGFSRKLDFAEVNNGKKYVEDIESISKYGRLEGIFSDDNISDKRELLNKTLDKLKEVKDPKFTYKVTLEYLNTLEGFEHYKCQKGDTILIIDEEENLILEARILEIEETEDITITLGSIQSGLVDSDFESEIGDIKDKVNQIENDKPNIDTIYPDTLPDVPILKAKALYSSVILDWTYSNKDYYTYELFASKIKDFNPTSDNRIFEGKASSFLHEVKSSETWYYRVRAKNTYGKTTLFSSQIKAVTFKISDSAEIFEEAAIGHAIIRDLDMDKATVGKLKGQFIEARNLEVIDGNGKSTLRVDSFGRVYLDVTELSIDSKKVISEGEINSKIEVISNSITEEVTNVAQGNLIVNGAYETANIYGWNIGGIRTVVENYYYHDRSLNYININSPNSGSSSWSNRFEVEASKDYQLSGLFFCDPNLTLTIKIKFSNSIPNANDFEHDGQFDEELTLERWQSSSNAFIEKFFVFKAPVTAKTAFIEIIYNNGIGYCGWTEVMVVKGTKPIPYIEKKSSYSRVFEKLTPNSIINTVNKGLTEGSAIAVAGTILDENGFSQLNNNKLSVRLNNNGTHIYSFLEEGKVNGSIEALRDKRTNDDIMGMTHKIGAFLTISYPKPNAQGDYLSYVVFDKYGIAYPVPISIFEDVDLNGANLWLNKYTKDVGSRIFGGVRGDGRGFTSIQGTNLQFVNPASGEFHFNVTREDFDIYSSRVYVRGDLSVIGNKNCIQQTKYGSIPFYSNEDINSLLTDTGIDTYLETKEVNGKFICKVEIDEIIQECLNTKLPYNVYIDKKDFGDYRVDIKEPTYFIVESDKPIRFKYKLEARRKNFERESKTNNFMRKMTVPLPLNEIPDEPITKERESILYKPEEVR